MLPVYITPRVLGRFFEEHHSRINIDAELLLICPDGTPVRVKYLDVDKHGALILQAKPEPIHGYEPYDAEEFE